MQEEFKKIALEVAMNADDLKIEIKGMSGFILSRGPAGKGKGLLRARRPKLFSSREEIVETVRKTLTNMVKFANSTSPQPSGLTEERIADICAILLEHESVSTYARERRQSTTRP